MYNTGPADISTVLRVVLLPAGAAVAKQDYLMLLLKYRFTALQGLSTIIEQLHNFDINTHIGYASQASLKSLLLLQPEAVCKTKHLQKALGIRNRLFLLSICENICIVL